MECSAITEVVAHFTQGIQLTQSLPAGPDRGQWELELRLSLGPWRRAVMALPKSKKTYARGAFIALNRSLCSSLCDS